MEYPTFRKCTYSADIEGARGTIKKFNFLHNERLSFGKPPFSPCVLVEEAPLPSIEEMSTYIWPVIASSDSRKNRVGQQATKIVIKEFLLA